MRLVTAEGAKRRRPLRAAKSCKPSDVRNAHSENRLAFPICPIGWGPSPSSHSAVELGQQWLLGTGTVGTVFPETESGTGTAGTVFQELKPEPEPSFLFNCTETKKNLSCRGTAGTENRNRSNRSTPKP